MFVWSQENSKQLNYFLDLLSFIPKKLKEHTTSERAVGLAALKGSLVSCSRLKATLIAFRKPFERNLSNLRDDFHVFVY